MPVKPGHCPYCQTPLGNLNAAQLHVTTCWEERGRFLPKRLGDAVLQGKLTMGQAEARAGSV